MIKKKAVAIVGPTAVGKTALSIRLAHALDGEIISCDSMQIYKYMDIGTAKPSQEEQAQVLHHGIDIIDPKERFSVHDYIHMVMPLVEQLQKDNKLPIFVGGTGLYFSSLAEGVSFTNMPLDLDMREELNAEYMQKGGLFMLEKLRCMDPISANKLAVKDKKRIIRAIEIYQLTGKTKTQWDIESKSEAPLLDMNVYALSMPRDLLYERINTRVDAMIQAGWIDEVQDLIQRGVTPEDQAFKAIGYRQLYAYVRGEIERQEAIDLIKQSSRQYAKRQLTWIRHKSYIKEIDVGTYPEKALDFIIQDMKKS